MGKGSEFRIALLLALVVVIKAQRTQPEDGANLREGDSTHDSDSFLARHGSIEDVADDVRKALGDDVLTTETKKCAESFTEEVEKKEIDAKQDCMQRPACPCQQYRALKKQCDAIADGELTTAAFCEKPAKFSGQCSYSLYAALKDTKVALNEKDLTLEETIAFVKDNPIEKIKEHYKNGDIKRKCKASADGASACRSLIDVAREFTACARISNAYICEEPGKVFCLKTKSCLPYPDFKSQCTFAGDTCEADVKEFCGTLEPVTECEQPRPKHMCAACKVQSRACANIHDEPCFTFLTDGIEMAIELKLPNVVGLFDSAFDDVFKNKPFDMKKFAQRAFNEVIKTCTNKKIDCRGFIKKLLDFERCIEPCRGNWQQVDEHLSTMENLENDELEAIRLRIKEWAHSQKMQGDDDDDPTESTEGDDDDDPTESTEGGDDVAPTESTEGGEDVAPTESTEGDDDVAPTESTEGDDDVAPTESTEGDDDVAPTESTENCTKVCTQALDDVKICGSDKTFYSNKCEFDNALCLNPDLKEAMDSECEGDDDVAPTESTENCTKVCTQALDDVKICGSDKTFYSNKCEFDNALCLNPDLKEAMDSECEQTRIRKRRDATETTTQTEDETAVEESTIDGESVSEKGEWDGMERKTQEKRRAILKLFMLAKLDLQKVCVVEEGALPEALKAQCDKLRALIDILKCDYNLCSSSAVGLRMLQKKRKENQRSFMQRQNFKCFNHENKFCPISGDGEENCVGRDEFAGVCTQRCILKAKNYCENMCPGLPPPPAPRPILKPTDGVCNLKPSDNLKALVYKCAVFSNLKPSLLVAEVISHECEGLKCGDRDLEAGGEIDVGCRLKAVGKCALKVKLALRKEDGSEATSNDNAEDFPSIEVEAEILQVDCRGELGGRHVMKKECGLCVDPSIKTACECPNFFIKETGECCAINVCPRDGKCYADNGCATNENPCAQSKCGTCLTKNVRVKDLMDECGKCKNDEEAVCDPNGLYAVDVSVVRNQIVDVCLKFERIPKEWKSKEDALKYLLKNANDEEIEMNFKRKCPSSIQLPDTNCFSFAAADKIPPGEYMLGRGGIFASGKIVIKELAEDNVLEFDGLPEVIERKKSYAIKLKRLAEKFALRDGRFKIKAKAAEKFRRIKEKDGAFNVRFSKSGEYELVYESCAKVELLKKTVNVDCGEIKPRVWTRVNKEESENGTEVTTDLFVGRDKDAAVCKGWKVDDKKPYQMMRTDTALTNVAQRCFDSCDAAKADVEHEVSLPCELRPIKPIGACDKREKIKLCLKKRRECLELNAADIKDGMEKEVCSEDKSCCKKHVFKRVAMAINLALKKKPNYLKVKATGICRSKNSEQTEISWHVSDLEDNVLAENINLASLEDKKARVLKLANEDWAFKYQNLKKLKIKAKVKIGEVEHESEPLEIELPKVSIEIFAKDKFDCIEGEGAEIKFGIRPRRLADKIKLYCDDAECPGRTIKVGCGKAGKIVAVLGDVKVEKIVKNSLEPAAPTLSCDKKEQARGSLACTVRGVSSADEVTVSSSDQINAVVKKVFVEDKKVVRLRSKPEIAGNYSFYVSALVEATGMEMVESVVDLVKREPPQTCTIDASPAQGDFNTAFLLDLLSDAPNTEVSVSKGDRKVGPKSKNIPTEERKLKAEGTYEVKAVVSNEEGQSKECSATIEVEKPAGHDSESEITTFCGKTFEEIIDDVPAYLAMWRDDENPKPDSKMNECLEKVMAEKQNMEGQEICELAAAAGQASEYGVKLDNAELVTEECSRVVNEQIGKRDDVTTLERKRRSLDMSSSRVKRAVVDGPEPIICTKSENLLNEEMLDAYLDTENNNFDAITYDQDSIDTRKAFLSNKRMLIESLCATIETRQASVSMTYSNFQLYCNIVAEPDANNKVCFGEDNYCVELSDVATAAQFAEWECGEGGDTCYGYLLAAIVFNDDVMSESTSENFTMISSMVEFFYLNPKEYCFVESEDLYDKSKLTVPILTEAGKCYRFDSFNDGWRSSESTTTKENNDTLCVTEFGGPQAIAERLEPEPEYVEPPTTTPAPTTTSLPATTTPPPATTDDPTTDESGNGTDGGAGGTDGGGTDSGTDGTDGTGGTSGGTNGTGGTNGGGTDGGTDGSSEGAGGNGNGGASNTCVKGSTDVEKKYILRYQTDFDSAVSKKGSKESLQKHVCDKWPKSVDQCRFPCEIEKGSIVATVTAYGSEEQLNNYTDVVVEAVKAGDMAIDVGGVVPAEVNSFTQDGVAVFTTPAPSEDDEDDNSTLIIVVVVVVIVLLALAIIVFFVFMSKKNHNQKVVPSPPGSQQDMQSPPQHHDKQYASPRAEPGVANPVYDDDAAYDE